MPNWHFNLLIKSSFLNDNVKGQQQANNKKNNNNNITKKRNLIDYTCLKNYNHWTYLS